MSGVTATEQAVVLPNWAIFEMGKLQCTILALRAEMAELQTALTAAQEAAADAALRCEQGMCPGRRTESVLPPPTLEAVLLGGSHAQPPVTSKAQGEPLVVGDTVHYQGQRARVLTAPRSGEAAPITARNPSGYCGDPDCCPGATWDEDDEDDEAEGTDAVEQAGDVYPSPQAESAVVERVLHHADGEERIVETPYELYIERRFTRPT